MQERFRDSGGKNSGQGTRRKESGPELDVREEKGSGEFSLPEGGAPA